MHESESRRCRFVDRDLGRVAPSSLKGNLEWKWNMSRHTAQRKKRKICHLMRSSSLKATRKQMSWQKQERYFDEGCMAEARAKTNAARKRRGCIQLCSMQSAFTVWWKNGKIV